MKLIKTAFVITSLALSLSAFAAQNLQDKHGAMWPKEQNGFVTKNQCMKCHGSYTDLGKKTADLNVNPHHSHLGEVNCVECHKATQHQPQLMCNSCHQFRLKKKN